MFRKIIVFSWLILAAFINTGAQEAVPTFHCMSLYWSPSGGKPSREVTVHYRKAADTTWCRGHNMVYNPISGTTLDKADYRGSVINLDPATEYEFKLQLEQSNEAYTITASTWSEEFPEGFRIESDSRTTPLEITNGGTMHAYTVYDGNDDTINVHHQYDYCIKVSASYVVIRNFTLRGAGEGKGSWPPIGAIFIENGVHDVVIEGCDISDWGRSHPEPLIENHGFDRDAGVCMQDGSNVNIQRIIIQRNKIHHPTYTTNNSYQNGGDKYTHPLGPQGITIFNNQGNHVIRYNEIYSNDSHMFNDIISGSNNGSYEGVPGPDSDIYGNILTHCWDNALEVEGGGRNVRCWNNYMNRASDVIGNAAVSIGPLYIFRNIVDMAEWTPGGSPGRFVKMGYAGGEEWMTGHFYIYHNLSWQGDKDGVGSGFGGNRITKHCTSRNNIIHLRAPGGQAISDDTRNIDNSFDYDLFNGSVPSGSENNGIYGTPEYVEDAGFDRSAGTGNYQLKVGSDGFDDGVVIPNFSDGYAGNAPDIGVHEHGKSLLQFGVEAEFIPDKCPKNYSDPEVNAIHLE